MRKLLVILVVLAVSSSLLAEDRIIYKKKTVVDFEDVMLEGQIKKPTGSFLQDRTKAKFNTLIKMKEDFNKELVRSVDLLK